MTDRKRFYSIDILKFICSITIMLGHFQGQTHFIWFKDFRNGVKFSSGDTLFLFFMISGFLTAIGIDDILSKKYKDYILYKIKNLFPMAAISTIICLVISFLYLIIYRHFIYDIRFGIWTIINSISLTYSGGSIVLESGAINGQLWYMSVLIICYSFLYFSLWLKDKLNINLNTILIISVFICLGIDDYNICLPFLNPTFAEGYICFCLGILINILFNNIKNDAIKFRTLFVVSLLMFCGCVVLGIYNFELFFDYPNYIYIFVISPALLMIALYLDKYLTNKKIGYLGGISFENYLWHGCFIIIFECLEKLVPSLFADGYSCWHEIAFVFIVTIFSSFVHLFIEKKINNHFAKLLNL